MMLRHRCLLVFPLLILCLLPSLGEWFHLIIEAAHVIAGWVVVRNHECAVTIRVVRHPDMCARVPHDLCEVPRPPSEAPIVEVISWAVHLIIPSVDCTLEGGIVPRCVLPCVRMVAMEQMSFLYARIRSLLCIPCEVVPPFERCSAMRFADFTSGSELFFAGSELFYSAHFLRCFLWNADWCWPFPWC